jgi:ribosomal protein L1
VHNLRSVYLKFTMSKPVKVENWGAQNGNWI